MNDDLISRQVLIQALNKYAEEVNQDTDIHEAIEIAINLPTVQPKTDDILSYIDRISNSGMGKKKVLEYLRKYIEKSVEYSILDREIGGDVSYSDSTDWKV